MSTSIDYLMLQIESDLFSRLSSINSYGNPNNISCTDSGISFQNILNEELQGITIANGIAANGIAADGSTADGNNTSYDDALLSGLTGGYSTAGIYGLANSSAAARTSADGKMTYSDNLIRFIQNHEGFSATPYRGVDYQNRTVGYGHVVEAGENLEYLSQSDATQLLENDLQPCVDSVNKEFAGVKLTQPQFDCLVSFSFGLGTNIWNKVPKLTSDIKSGASAETLKQDFEHCSYCNGKQVQGLFNRRTDEWKMFVSGEYHTI